LGFAYDHSLFYVTGGLAYGETEQHVDMFGPTGNLQFSGDRRGLKAGFAAGAGLEQAIANNVTVKGEYLYYDLGKDTLDVAVIPGSGGAGTGYNSHFNNNGHILRVGLNYKLN
jgi:outer membrane immunogenic protein